MDFSAQAQDLVLGEAARAYRLGQFIDRGGEMLCAQAS